MSFTPNQRKAVRLIPNTDVMVLSMTEVCVQDSCDFANK